MRDTDKAGELVNWSFSAHCSLFTPLTPIRDWYETRQKPPGYILRARFRVQDDVDQEEPTKAYSWYVEESDDEGD